MRAKLIKESLHSLPTWNELISEVSPEILDLIEQSKTVPQSLKYHPENTVYKHIRIVFDRARKYGDINLLLAGFFHDLGKMKTTKDNNKGGWSAHGHEVISADLAKNNIDLIIKMGGDPDEVIEIVAQHMRIKQMDKMRSFKQNKLKSNPYYDKLLLFTDFDDMKTLTDDELNRYK